MKTLLKLFFCTIKGTSRKLRCFFVFKNLPRSYGNWLPLPRKLLNQLMFYHVFDGNLPAIYQLSW